MRPFKKGMIIMWSGTLASVPGGWALCNGDNGTPDMHGRFVMCAGATHAPNTTGGHEGHTHTYTGDGHKHGGTLGEFAPGSGDMTLHDEVAESGTTDNSAFKPSYYVLAYIMKL